MSLMPDYARLKQARRKFYELQRTQDLHNILRKLNEFGETMEQTRVNLSKNIQEVIFKHKATQKGIHHEQEEQVDHEDESKVGGQEHEQVNDIAIGAIEELPKEDTKIDKSLNHEVVDSLKISQEDLVRTHNVQVVPVAQSKILSMDDNRDESKIVTQQELRTILFEEGEIDTGVRSQAQINYQESNTLGSKLFYGWSSTMLAPTLLIIWPIHARSGIKLLLYDSFI